MDKTEALRVALAKLIADNMGKEAGRLFYEFYKDDEAEDMADGARALLITMIGPILAHKKIEEVKKVIL